MPSWVRTPGVWLALLLALFAARLLHTAHAKSFTADEPHYVGTGLYLWESGDYHWFHVLKLHPPLTHHLASLPLLGVDLGKLEPSPQLGAELVRAQQPSPQRVRFLSRLPFVVLACWGALLVFWWTREVAGPGAGLLAAFLYTNAPNLLAHGALVSSDLVVSICMLQALYTFWRWSMRPSAARLALAGVSLGLALLAKMQAVLLPLALVPVVAVLAWQRATPRRVAFAAGALAGLAALSILTLMLGYGGSLALSTGPPGPLEDWSLPGWLRPLLFDWSFNQTDRRFFVLGHLQDHAAWWFLPLGLLLKTPLGVLALAAAAALAPGSDAARRARLGLVMGVPVAVYLGIAVFWLRLPMGVRYVLPLVPLLHVFVAVRLVPLASGRRRAAVALACAWIAASGLLAHPHYLAYYNELAGGPAGGHRFFVESNLDWGQDLSTLARTLRARGNPTVHLAYFGPEPARNYGIRAVPLTGCAPVEGLVAISANVRAGLYRPDNWFEPPPPGCYDWLREHEPVATPGHSIFVYDLANAREHDPPVAP